MIFKVSCETEDLHHRNKTYFKYILKKKTVLHCKMFTIFHNLLLLLFIVKCFTIFTVYYYYHFIYLFIIK